MGSFEAYNEGLAFLSIRADQYEEATRRAGH